MRTYKTSRVTGERKATVAFEIYERALAKNDAPDVAAHKAHAAAGHSLHLSKRDLRQHHLAPTEHRRKRWTASPVTDKLTAAGRQQAAEEAARRVRRKIRAARSAEAGS